MMKFDDEDNRLEVGFDVEGAIQLTDRWIGSKRALKTME